MGMLYSTPVAVRYRTVAELFRRPAVLVLLTMAVVGALSCVLDANVARAQDVIADEDSEIVADEAAPVAAPAAPSEIAQAAQAAPRRRSYLTWLYGSLGPMYSLIFLGLSFSLVAVLVMNILVARRRRSCRPV